jgi:hypothetical protein
MCYLCSNRENCDVSCSYLDTPRVSSSLDESVHSKINLEIKKYQEEIGRLSALHAKGKIGEQSFLAATNTLKQKIQELESDEFEESTSPSLLASLESDEFEESTNQVEKPTALWYMVPFFFGIIGGIVGYIGTKDEDKGMADSLLIFGLLWSFILIIVIYVFVLSHIRFF